MKTYLYSCILLLIAFSACSKKESSNAETSENFVKAKVDGTERNCNAAITGVYDKANKIITFFGRYGSMPDLGGFDLSIRFITKPVGAGTFLMGNSPNTPHADGSHSVSERNPDKDYYSSQQDGGSGKIVITSFDNNVVKGTFEFIGVNTVGNSKKITEGSFQVKLDEL